MNNQYALSVTEKKVDHMGEIDDELTLLKGRTIRKVIGGGVGNFQLARMFFFAHCLCRNFFFR